MKDAFKAKAIETALSKEIEEAFSWKLDETRLGGKMGGGTSYFRIMLKFGEGEAALRCRPPYSHSLEEAVENTLLERHKVKTEWGRLKDDRLKIEDFLNTQLDIKDMMEGENVAKMMTTTIRSRLVEHFMKEGGKDDALNKINDMEIRRYKELYFKACKETAG